MPRGTITYLFHGHLTAPKVIDIHETKSLIIGVEGAVFFRDQTLYILVDKHNPAP